MINKEVNRTITLAELKKHDGEIEPWFVVNGQVYDGTKFLEGHPGGAHTIDFRLLPFSTSSRSALLQLKVGHVDDLGTERKSRKTYQS